MHLFIAHTAAILVAGLWQAALLALATAALLRLLPTLSASSRSRIWTAAFLFAAVLPFASVIQVTRIQKQPHSEFHAAFTLAVSAGGTWAAASLVRAIQLALSAFHLHGIARRATPCLTSIPSAALLCTSTEVDIPAVAGFFHPRILIPAALLPTLSPADLHHIVLHECEHLRRRDDWTNLLQKLTLVLFPISPALLWMERRLCLERELACDDGVLRTTGTAKPYATTLANLAEHSLLRRSLSLALGAMRHQSEVARRVHRILARPLPTLPPRRAIAISTFALAGILATAVVCIRTPQLIAFTALPTVSLAEATPASSVPTASTGPRPVLVRASMPMPQATLVPTPNARVHTVHRTKLVHKPAAVHPTQPWIVLTTYHAPISQPRVIPVAYQVRDADQVPTLLYAAVPTRTGWLIIQL